MKIALVCRHYTLKKGGLEKYTVFLSRALARKGCEVHVFANTHMDEPVAVHHHVPLIRASSPAKHLSFAYFLQKRLQKRAFDVIQSMERTFFQDIFRVSDGINHVQMQWKYPNPKIRRIKALGPRRQVLTRLERHIFLKGGCRAIMTNSELVRRQILEHYPADPSKISVVYNGVDLDRFNPEVRKKHRAPARKLLGVTPDQTLVLFVSNDFKLKRLDLIVDALAILNDPSFKLVVAGNDNPAPYRKRIETLGLESRILFVGPQKEIEKYYAAADVFVLPTLYDAFANVCLEAMACALPVLTTENNGAAELIEDGRQGYVLKTLRAGELADRLAGLKPGDAATAMGLRAARRASAFTLDRHLSEVLKLYERIRSTKKV